MTTRESRRIRKKKIFHLDELVIQQRLDKFKCNYVSAVYYEGRRIKRYKTSARFIYKIDDCIVKIETDIEPRAYRGQTLNEINFYSFVKAKDRIFFPKLIAHDLIRGIVVQELINFKSKRTKEQRSIVDKLIKKYQIDSDIDSIYNYNWGVNKETNLPVIYDLGYY